MEKQTVLTPGVLVAFKDETRFLALILKIHEKLKTRKTEPPINKLTDGRIRIYRVFTIDLNNNYIEYSYYPKESYTRASASKKTFIKYDIPERLHSNLLKEKVIKVCIDENIVYNNDGEKIHHVLTILKPEEY